jgi:hypothetical protein
MQDRVPVFLHSSPQSIVLKRLGCTSSTRTPRDQHVSARNRSWVACEHSSKELFEQLILLLFGTSTYVDRNLYSTVFPSFRRNLQPSRENFRCKICSFLQCFGGHFLPLWIRILRPIWFQIWNAGVKFTFDFFFVSLASPATAASAQLISPTTFWMRISFSEGKTTS